MTNTQTPAQVAQNALDVYKTVLAQGLAEHDPEAYSKAVDAYLVAVEAVEKYIQG